MHFYDIDKGIELVKAARSSIELYIKSPRFYKGMVSSNLLHFKDKYGIFVTLEHYPTRTLRGCIGFLYGNSYVYHTLVDAAIAAAFEDPRFVPISHYELDEMLIEVNVLSDMTDLGKSAASRKKNLMLGRDGISIEYGIYRGLLLPGVAVDENLTKEEFLNALCDKAGLPSRYWMQPNVKMYRFETQIFREEKPNGNVIDVNLKRMIKA
ncbi:MAG: TIGR00296 family protein [Candidatus Marsarchaeota archaeon]|nr:TIGR00296 family protein [Candidatus Marsarchaeota archaeon]